LSTITATISDTVARVSTGSIRLAGSFSPLVP
jgi:hypothetical protein